MFEKLQRLIDEYHSFATESFSTLQGEGREFAIDTPHQAPYWRSRASIMARCNPGSIVVDTATRH